MPSGKKKSVKTKQWELFDAVLIKLSGMLNKYLQTMIHSVHVIARRAF